MERQRSASQPSSKVSAITFSVRGPRETTWIDPERVAWPVRWPVAWLVGCRCGLERTAWDCGAGTGTEPRSELMTSWLPGGSSGITVHGATAASAIDENSRTQASQTTQDAIPRARRGRRSRANIRRDSPTHAAYARTDWKPDRQDQGLVRISDGRPRRR